MKDPLAPFNYTLDLPVLWGHMDSMGHVNNTVYFRYMESARLEYILRFEPERFGAGMILGSTSCKFVFPLTYPDTITVGARIVKLEKYKAHMEQIIVSQTHQRVAAVGTAVLVGYDYETLAKAPIPDPVRKIMIELDNPEIVSQS